MANYNTFQLVETKTNKTLLTTSSAMKVKKQLDIGLRIEVWNNNKLVKKIYKNTEIELKPYIEEERRYIARKQYKAEMRNKKKKISRAYKTLLKGV